MVIHLQQLWKNYQNIFMIIHKKTHLLVRQMGLRQYKKLQNSNLSYSILKCEPDILGLPLHSFSQYDNRKFMRGKKNVTYSNKLGLADKRA